MRIDADESKRTKQKLKLQTTPISMFNRIRKFFAKPASNSSCAVESKGTTVERKTLVVSKKHDPKEVKP